MRYYIFLSCLLLGAAPLATAADLSTLRLRGTVDGPSAPAVDDEVAVASVGLRAGYDTDPTLASPARPSAYLGAEAAFAFGRSVGGVTAGMVGELSRADYGASGIDPAEHYRLSFQLANKDDGPLALRSTTGIEETRAYDVRAFEAVQSLRARWTGGPVQPFATAELRYASLNETNAIFPLFLPEDERFLRGTVIPGVALKQEKAEIGASINLSMTRYADEFDVFGFRRDNERVQPFLFFRYGDGDFTVFATLSQLYGYWHDPDFSDVRRMLYEVSIGKDVGPFTVDVTMKRVAADTTFPISPLAITSLSEGRVSWPIGDNDRLTLLARDIETEYLDSPFSARSFTYGGGISHALMDDLALGFELTRTDAVTIAGDDVAATAAVVSLTKKFGSGGATPASSLPPSAVGPRVSSRPPALP